MPVKIRPMITPTTRVIVIWSLHDCNALQTETELHAVLLLLMFHGGGWTDSYLVLLGASEAAWDASDAHDGLLGWRDCDSNFSCTPVCVWLGGLYWENGTTSLSVDIDGFWGPCSDRVAWLNAALLLASQELIGVVEYVSSFTRLLLLDCSNKNEKMFALYQSCLWINSSNGTSIQFLLLFLCF